MRALVVEEDRLVPGIRRGVIDPLTGLLGRKVSVLSEQLTGNRGCDNLELGRACERKAAEQDRPVTVQITLDLVGMAATPTREVDAVDRGRDHQREVVLV